MKRKTIVKSKPWLIITVVAVVFLTFGVVKVLGQVADFPRVKMACEGKNGNLTAIDDGFSMLKDCPGEGRKVLLGEEPTVLGGGSGLPTAGNVLFLGGSILMKDGSVWYYSGESWTKDVARELPTSINLSDIIQWGDDYFLTKTGDVYRYDYGQSWRNVGSPTL